MSERQAKKSRSEIEKETKKTGNKQRVISNIIAVALIVAVAGLGGYAVWSKTGGFKPAADSQQTDAAQTDDAASQQGQDTIDALAKSQNTTADELIKKCGMEKEGLTGSSSSSEMYEKFTIDSYAKFSDTTADELKKKYGLESMENDVKWSDAQKKIKMEKLAAEQGKSFEDFAKENNLPETIKKDTTYAEAMTIMQQQAAQATPAASAEAPAASENK